MMWMLILVLALPQGVTSNILPFSDRGACARAKTELETDFKLLPLGKGGWAYMDCLPTKGVPT